MEVDTDIDVHVVVGQGVGFTAIPKKAKRYLIVADSLGNHAVYNYAAGSEQIKPYKKETFLGEDIYYFLINL
jgi:hypothetical protein